MLERLRERRRGEHERELARLEGNALDEIDNNIFDHLTGGILIRDTNNVIVAYNLFFDCDEVGVDTVSGINGPRSSAFSIRGCHWSS